MKLKKIIVSLLACMMIITNLSQLSFASEAEKVTFSDEIEEESEAETAAPVIETEIPEPESESEPDSLTNCKVINGFEYPDNYLVVNDKGTAAEIQKKLPDQVSVNLIDGTQANISVEWSSQDDYDHTDYDDYIFDMLLPDGYKMWDTLNFGDMPYIEVKIDESLTEDVHDNILNRYRVWSEDNYGYDIQINGRKEVLLTEGEKVTVFISEYGEYSYTDVYAVNKKEEYADIEYSNSSDTYSFVMSSSNTVVRLHMDMLNNAAVYTASTWAAARASTTADTHGEPSSQTLTYWDDSMYRENVGLTVGYFELNGISGSKNTGTKALCVYHSKTHPDIGDTLTITSVYDSTATGTTAAAVRKILYYGYGGPAEVDISNSGYSRDDDGSWPKELWRRTSLALSYILNNDDNAAGWGQMFYEDYIKDKPDPPSSFVAFVLSPGNSVNQPLAYGKMVEEKGALKLTKVSAEPGVTDDNSCYSLSGAEYTVYKTNKNGVLNDKAAVLTTNAQGNSNIVELTPGTYYVKETKAATGYELDDTIYSVNVTADSTTTKPVQLSVKDMPGHVPPSIKITKIVNGEESEECPSLEGTQFTVMYYDGYYTKNNLPSTPIKTWVFETKKSSDGSYLVLFTEDYLVKVLSDELYKINGKAVLPLGTITIQETKPAEGYTLKGYLKDKDGNIISTDSEIYLSQITEENGTAVLKGGNEYTAEDTPEPGFLKLHKSSALPVITDENECYSLSGAEYTVYKSDNDGTLSDPVAVLTTDENGDTETVELYPDTYYIKETTSAEGYYVDDMIYTVNVTYENTIDQPVLLSVSDVPGYDSPGIEITKLIDGEATEQCPPLTGAQFTVKYYDGYYTQSNLPENAVRTWVLQTVETDGSYIACFSDECKVAGDEFYYMEDIPVMPLGTITVQETQPAPGYTLNGYMMDKEGNKVSVDSEIYLTQITMEDEIVSLNGGNEYSVYDTPEYGRIKIVKYDSDGNTTLSGVTFALKELDGTVVDEGTTDSTGTVTFEDLYPGRYLLTEVSTVSGHTLLVDPVEITVPMTLTEQEANDQNIDRTQCIYNEFEDVYYIYDFTYEITNGATLILPTTGGFESVRTRIPIVFAFMIFGCVGYYFMRQKHVLY
ncbi:MAG: SpaA isopeptide-forming pilin-related protein [Coprococcus sp.]